jgi:SAM-dependent methyltransferase
MYTGDEGAKAWWAGRQRLIRTAVAGTPACDGLVIDVAAGDGELSALVAGLTGGQLVTADRSGDECRRAAASGLPAVRSNVLQLPFRDGCADVVIAFEILEHFPRWQACTVIEELWRVTKPGGMLLLSTPNRYSLRSFKGIFGYLRTGAVWNALDETHVTIYSYRDLLRALEPRFRVARSFGYYLIPEVGSHSTPWTFVQTSNRLLIPACHKLLVVAERRGGARDRASNQSPSAQGAPKRFRIERWQLRG